jgi:hypothetical protein
MSLRILAIAALVSTPAFASEGVLNETGDTRASATNIDGFFTLPPPEIVFVPIPGVPSLGTVGFLTKSTNSSEIVCSSWKTIDTSAPAGPTPPSRARAERVGKRSRQ